MSDFTDEGGADWVDALVDGRLEASEREVRREYDAGQWIRHIDRLREFLSELLKAGEWHGYLDGGGMPRRGRYCLMRWESPMVVVFDDDPERVVELAEAMELALENGGWA